MRAIYVPISAEDLAVLRDLATEKRRRPQDQASVIIVEALKRRRPTPKPAGAPGTASR